MSCDELSVSAWPCTFFDFEKAYRTLTVRYMRKIYISGSFISVRSRSTVVVLHRWFQLPPSPTTGTHKIKYHAREDRDFQLHVDHLPVDLTLIIPHYRAHNQPVDHKLSMDIKARSASIKLKVVRLQSKTWFPSDWFLSFSGSSVGICHCLGLILRCFVIPQMWRSGSLQTLKGVYFTGARPLSLQGSRIESCTMRE